MTTDNAARKSAQTPGAATYALLPGESERIQIWRLMMTFMMPLHHAFSTPNRAGGAAVATLIMPGWLYALEYVLTKVVMRCVPSAFALIAGVLLFRKPFSWRENARKKCRTLLGPLFLLTSLWIALYAAGPHVPGLRRLFSDFTSRVPAWTPRQWFAAYLGWTPEHSMPTILYPLWFLRDLMLMNLLAPAIQRCVDRFPRLFLALLAVLLVWNTDSGFFYYTVHQTFIFFSLGCYVVKHDLHLRDLDRVPLRWIAAPYALTVLGAWLLRDWAPWCGAVRGIPNLLGVLFLAKCLARVPASPAWARRLTGLAKYNIAIHLFHERMLSFAKKLLLHLLPACLPTTLTVLYLLPLANIAACVLLAQLLRARLPRAYALLTGAR